MAIWLLLSACQISLSLAAPVTLASMTSAYDPSSSSTAATNSAIPTTPDDDFQAAGSLFSILSTSKCQVASTPLPPSGTVTRREWDPIDKPYVLALFMLGVILVGIIVACRTVKGCSPQIHPGDVSLRYTAPRLEGGGRTARHHAAVPAAAVGTGPGMSGVGVFASRGGERRQDQGSEPRALGRLLGDL